MGQRLVDLFSADAEVHRRVEVEKWSWSLANSACRAADGLKDPETGEFNGLSAAYEMEGLPAFIPSEQGVG